MKSNYVAMVLASVLLLLGLIGCKGAAAAGVYNNAKPGDASIGSNLGNYYELKSDGTFFLGDYKGGGTVGQWRIEHNEITLIFQVLGSNIARKGTLVGGTLNLDDGSSWVDEKSVTKSGTPGSVIKAWDEALRQGRYDDALKYYSPKGQEKIIRNRDFYKQNAPQKGEIFWWQEAFRNLHAEYGWTPPAWEYKWIKVIGSQISVDDTEASVNALGWYINASSLENDLYPLVKVGNTWKLGWKGE